MLTQYPSLAMLLVGGLMLSLTSCHTSSGIFNTFGQNKVEKMILESPVFQRGFTGFYLSEASNGKVLAKVNENKYFIPASNTKILTLYTALRYLPDTLPRYRFQWKGDTTLYLRATGDPTLLHPNFAAWNNLTLPPYKKLWWDISNWQDLPYGPGWMWDDFEEKFCPKRSAMPFKGNLINNKPIHNPDSLILQHVLKGGAILATPPLGRWTTISQTPLDTVLRVMMYDSDNHLAEQLLLMSADAISDTLKSDIVINRMQYDYFASMPQPPTWHDGSGITRYNLASPIFFDALLRRMYKEYPQTRLFSLFPAGGISGTLRNRYKSPDGKPYVFAKTGSMRGVVTLCGYLRAKSGKILTFSFLHNNVNGSTNDFHEEMEKVLVYIKENF